MRWTLVLLAAAAAALPSAGRACSVCACGDPLVAAAEGQGQGGDLRLALDTEYLHQTAGTEGMPGSTDVLDQVTLRLTVVYSPLERLNLVAMLPFAFKRMTMDMGQGQPAVPVSDLAGIADMELAARWFVVDAVDFAARRRQGVAIAAGTSLPTGGNAAVDASGQRIDEHGQLGTGAWGPYAGVSYRFQQDPGWAALVSVTGRLRTENAFGYRYGSALLWTAQGQWSPWEWLALGLAYEGRNAGVDRQDGAPVENTGGLVMAATPSAYVNVYRGLWLNARAQLPFYSSLKGEQSVGPTVLVGIAYQVL